MQSSQNPEGLIFYTGSQEALIKSISFTPNTETLEPGDVLIVRLVGKAGGTARFSVGGTVQNQPMREESGGIYVGSYTVKKGDSLAQAPVSASLTIGGRTVSQTAESALTIAAGAPDKPTITAPAPNTAIGDTLTLSGKAAPNTTVRYEVRYQGNLVVLPVTGVLATGEVKADAKGDWKTEAIKISNPAGVSRLTYRVAAVAIGAAAEQSEATTLELKKQ